MKKIVINLLAISLISTSIVACGSGGSSSQSTTPPAAPSTTPVTPPTNFVIPADSTSGAAFNISNSQIALPNSSGYTTINIPTNVNDSIAATAATPNGLNSVTVTSNGGPNDNSNILISMPGTTPNTTLTYVLNGIVQSTHQAQATSNSAESFTYLTNYVKTNVIAVPATSVTGLGVAFGYNINGTTGAAIIAPNPNPQAPIYTPLSNCSGASGAPSAIYATSSNDVAYVSIGTSAGSVCVLNGANLSFANLSAQAPTAKYTPGNVNGFGFPYSLNTGTTLVGYWNVGTVGTNVNIYRVTGTYINGAPTGNGFLNTTMAGQQTTTNGTTVVTFTGFPANSSINSSYTDSAGNVWVGTNAGNVYVLRTGQTQWTSTSLTGATGAVTVQTNGSSSGATATTLVGGSVQSFAVN